MSAYLSSTSRTTIRAVSTRGPPLAHGGPWEGRKSPRGNAPLGDDSAFCRALLSKNGMERGGKQRTDVGTKTAYRIVVGGELSERYAAAFEGMEMEAKDGQTILTGEIIDQPQLHGILDRINALGLKLVSVEPTLENPK